MRTMTTIGAVLLLAVGVGRGDPPSGPTTPASPDPTSAPVATRPPIPPELLNWKKTERIDTPTAPPVAKPGEAGEKGDAKKLKEEMEKLLKEKEPSPKAADKAESTDERARLRNKLDDILDKLDQQKKTPKTAPPKPADGHDPNATPPKPVLPEGGKPIDLVRAAGNLYKSGDTEGAFELLKTVDTNQLSKEDRAFADYVRAACLRRMGKTTEAVKLYMAIANAKDDKFLAESAVVQVTAIKSTQELETQLEQLKSRRKPK